MVGAMGETAALFLAYSSFQNLIRAYSPSSASDGAQSKLSISQLALAAGGAGFVTSFILFVPFDVLVHCDINSLLSTSCLLMNFFSLGAEQDTD